MQLEYSESSTEIDHVPITSHHQEVLTPTGRGSNNDNNFIKRVRVFSFTEEIVIRVAEVQGNLTQLGLESHLSQVFSCFL